MCACKVNSHQLPEVSSSAEPEWPYATSVPTTYASSVPRITSDPSQYALANGNMLPLSTAAPYLGPASGRGQSFQDVSNSLYPAAPSRQSFPSSYYGNLENQSFQQYDMQPSRQAFPLQMSQAPTPGYPAADPSNHWVPLSTNTRSQYHSLNFDQDVSSSYAPSTFPYLATTGPPASTGAPERSSIFPGLSPLVTHLPVHGSNRILPNPTSLHSSFDSSNGSAHEGDGELGLFQQHLDKSSDSWDLNRLTMGTSQGSVSSAVQDTICASGSTSSTSSSSPSDTQEITKLGYLPMTQTSPIGSTLGSSGYRSADTLTTLNTDTYTGTTTPHLQSRRHRNSQLPSINTPFNLYGTSGGVSNSANPVTTSGQAAPRILQPQPRHSSSYDLHRSSSETNPQPRGKILKSNVNSHQSRGKR